MNAFPTCFGFARVAANRIHVICKINGWKIPGHIVTDVYSSCYFIYNALRDKVTEKEFDIVIQMTFDHVLVQRFKKKEMHEKNNF